MSAGAANMDPTTTSSGTGGSTGSGGQGGGETATVTGTVVTVENGREAVDAAAAGDFDIIFMDIELPDMDGIEAAQQIVQMEEGSGRKTSIPFGPCLLAGAYVGLLIGAYAA